MPGKRLSKRSANTLAAAPSVKPSQLTAEQSHCVDALFRAEDRLRRFGKLKRRAKRLRKRLQEAFGPAYLAFTTDGRLIQRRRNARSYDPLPAKTIEWEDFAEIPRWDV